MSCQAYRAVRNAGPPVGAEFVLEILEVQDLCFKGSLAHVLAACPSPVLSRLCKVFQRSELLDLGSFEAAGRRHDCSNNCRPIPDDITTSQPGPSWPPRCAAYRVTEKGRMLDEVRL